MQTARRVTAVCVALVLIALAVFVISLMSGSVEMSVAELWRGLHSTDALSHTLLFELRLPRTLTAFAAGGVLALAGVLMQVLLRNPLADPFVMGVSGGAAVAALSAMLLGMSGLLIDASATLGSSRDDAAGFRTRSRRRRLDCGAAVVDGCSRRGRRERRRQHVAHSRRRDSTAQHAVLADGGFVAEQPTRSPSRSIRGSADPVLPLRTAPQPARAQRVAGARARSTRGRPAHGHVPDQLDPDRSVRDDDRARSASSAS